MAGEEGIEPPTVVLETTIMPLNYSPSNQIRSRLLGFLVHGALTLARTVLNHLQTLLVELFVLFGVIVNAMARSTLKAD